MERTGKACPVCEQEDLLLLLTYETPVLSNALFVDVESAYHMQLGHMAITFCRSCTHIFNSSFNGDHVRYEQAYDSSLDFSPSFAVYSRELSKRLNETYALRGKTIVDVGCGKGTFLEELCAVGGARGIGFDRTYEPKRAASNSHIRYIQDYFDDRYCDFHADFVTCRHVLEHVAKPGEFLRGLARHPALGPDTIFYFELPNALYMLREGAIWDLIHEHVSYFTPLSLHVAFSRAGFKILDSGTSFNGQYLYVEAKRASPSADRKWTGDLVVESLAVKFSTLFRSKIQGWQSYFIDYSPAKTVVWGAGAKGISFVNIVPGGDRIAALVDVNPFKNGRFAPRHGTKVISPEELGNRAVQSIIVMNPNYRHEIQHIAASVVPAADILMA